MRLQHGKDVFGLHVGYHVPHERVQLQKLERVANLVAIPQKECLFVDLSDLRLARSAVIVIARHDGDLLQELVCQSENDVLADEGTISTSRGDLVDPDHGSEGLG